MYKMTENTYYKKFLEVAAPLNHTLISDVDNIVSTNSVITFQCYPCETERTTTLKDYFRRQSKTCKECNSWKLTQIPTWNEVLHEALKQVSDLKADEEWRPIVGGWISSYGKAINSIGKVLTLDTTKDRYSIGGKQQYRTILISEAFKNKVDKTKQALDLEKATQDKPKESLSKGEKTLVSLKDKNAPLSVENLQLITCKEMRPEGAKNVRSERFNNSSRMSLFEKMEQGIAYKSIPELPDHVIFKDGNIFNKQAISGGNRFLAFSVTKDDYLYFFVGEQNYRVHRLVCMAFHPIEGKNEYKDYKGLECNHKDGNKSNNHADNLEWTTHSENMQHAYDTKLNKKVRSVLQYAINEDKSQGNFIAEFISIAEACRQTNIPEHRIRETANGKMKPKEFIWKFKDESISEEWSKKFCSKPKAKAKIVMPSTQDA